MGAVSEQAAAKIAAKAEAAANEPVYLTTQWKQASSRSVPNPVSNPDVDLESVDSIYFVDRAKIVAWVDESDGTEWNWSSERNYQ